VSDVAIIGAGLSGLSCAHELIQKGFKVELFDKGKKPGGRLATRNAGQARYDHGAQYFTARDPHFQKTVSEWIDQGVVKIWTDQFATDSLRGEKPQEKYPRYCGVSGMRGLAEHLSKDLAIHNDCRIDKIHFHSKWTLTSDKGKTFQSRSILLTMPVPQSLQLLNDSGMTVPEARLTELRKVEYWPCLALMCTMSKPTRLPLPGGIFLGPEPISWIADNSQKGISQAHCLTIHAGPVFSQTHYNTHEAEVIKQLLLSAQEWLDGTILHHELHRWRYSLPRVTYPERSLLIKESQLAFAGDAFQGPRVEGAFLSGQDAAKQLLTIL
jgi:renalase